jgi:ATP-dependent Clp protease ATP-binding subunit ClpB
VGNLLFLGPTGSGKTRIVEAAAEILFGDARALVKADCAEFQHSHEIAKLIGSPPGYLGHRETHPLITQEALAALHTDKLKLSFLLFDEIEKASDALIKTGPQPFCATEGLGNVPRSGGKLWLASR